MNTLYPQVPHTVVVGCCVCLLPFQPRGIGAGTQVRPSGSTSFFSLSFSTVRLACDLYVFLNLFYSAFALSQQRQRRRNGHVTPSCMCVVAPFKSGYELPLMIIFCIDVFIGLNGVRILSIVALLLVFSSNIVTLVNDVKAMNRFMEAGKVAATGASINATLDASRDFDYIACVSSPSPPFPSQWHIYIGF